MEPGRTGCRERRADLGHRLPGLADSETIFEKNQVIFVDDSRYLELVTESIGQEIRELKLNVYGCPAFEESNHWRKQTTLITVFKLIAKCPSLESLSLRAMTDMGKLERCEHQPIYKSLITDGALEFLSELASGVDSADCKAILEKLKNLHLVRSGWRHVFFSYDRPKIKFNSRSSLTLIECKLAAAERAEFLGQVQNVLTNLIMEGTRIIDHYGVDSLEMRARTPMTLPRLETLVVWDGEYRIDRGFVNNLVCCEELKRVKLSFDCDTMVNQEVLAKLASVLSERETTIELRYPYKDGVGNRWAIDSESRFVLVTAFGDMITQYSLEYG